MKIKVLLPVIALAITAAVIGNLNNAKMAFAAEEIGEQTSRNEGGTASTDQELHHGNGNSGTATGNGQSGVVSSRATGWELTTVPASGVIQQPSLDYGSIHIPATEMSTGNAAAGATWYMYGVYAQESGYVKLNGVKTYVQAGQFLTAIPVSGIQKADGSYMKEFAAAYYAKQVYGTQYVKNAYGLNESSVLAIYQQLIDTGRLTINDLLNGDFRSFGGLDGLVETLGEAEVMKILAEVPVPPAPPIPLLSCNVGSHAGWTDGKAQVQNFTTGTGWQSEVWARPGDTVQFMIEYCWGVGAVGGTVGNSSRPYSVVPQTGIMFFGKPVDEVYFMLSATQNEKYLFGENEQVISGGQNDLKRILTNPHAQNIGGTGVGFGDGNVDKTGGYAFTVLSPGQKDSGKYACTIYDFAPYYTSPGYQIPGVAEGSCPAISNNGGIMSDVSNSYGIISQTIKYNYATAWQLWRHNQEGNCLGCTQNPESPTPYIRSKDKEPAPYKTYNSLDEYNANTRSNPFTSMEAALGAGVNDWGLIIKHAGDTALHRQDCDSSQCGCRGWHTLCSAGGHKCCGYCAERDPEYPCADGNGMCGGGCARYEYYDCYQDCTGSGMSLDGPCECEGPSGPLFYWPTYDYSTSNLDYGERASTAKVNVPYNYYTSTTSGINADDRIYLGEGVSSNFVVSILPRGNTSVHNGEPYATLHDGMIKAVEFVVSAEDNLDAVGGNENTPQDPCAYYQSNLRVISGCNTIWQVDPMLNPQGRYSGWTYTQVVDRVVPDNPDAFSEDLVGARYCVAVGISHSDSHGQPGGGVVSGMSNPSDWRVSGASCRTIAKKPNFQVWNGHMYTNGSINTSLTRKHVNANLGDSADPTGLFGSWDEYYVTAAGEINGFASGAALGYYGKERNTSLGLQGGNSPDAEPCDISKMTISNEGCDTDLGTIGYSNIRKSMDVILERLYSRYTNPSSSDGVSVLANGATYVNYNGDINTSQIKNLSGANSSLLVNTEFGPSYIRQTKSSINSESEQTTSNYASNTLVIYVNGKLTIDTNICTGSGDCSIGNNGGYLTLQGRNNDWYSNIYSLPQVLIIAKKGIVVTENVNQIDAWLITDGNVDTCAQFKVGSGSSEQCTNPLIINGPVIAKSLTLDRTAGANPGSGNPDTSNVLYKNLANDGSITPGEIFNLRPDTLFWAYGQSQRFSQANVTYTRELAPRY